MNFDRSRLLLAVLGGLTLSLALAQDNAKDRVVRVGEARTTGNPQSGPLTMVGRSEGEQVRSTVSNLTLSSDRVVLSAPNGTTFAGAEGKRNAEFSGRVTVSRGRVNANGPTLSYSEASGLGTLRGGAQMTYAPENADPVRVSADAMEFDVDTETSVSKGNVRLVNGRQSTTSDNLSFNEKTELAVLTGGRVTLTRQAASASENNLVMSGTEARIQTGKDKKLLLMTGRVTLVDGNITTTGDTVFYDDKKNIAVVVGRPAVSVTKRSNGTEATVRGVTLEQRTDKNTVRQLTSGFKIPTESFK